MEQAIFIATVAGLKHYTAGFSRVYFGNEFCEHLIPAVADLEPVLALVRENGLDLTLVTPYVTDSGLQRLYPLLDRISAQRPGSEVVFNDYGVLRVLTSRYLGLEPVMGRLLNRMKRGPRLMMVIDKLPPTTVEYFRGSNLNVPALGRFLSGHRVRRVELDNVLQGIDFTAGQLTASLYVPFVYVTTTRLCLANSADIPERAEMVGIFPCRRECQQYTFYLNNPVMPVTLIRKGNTVFLENATLPDEVEHKRITRIVTQPEIPI